MIPVSFLQNETARRDHIILMILMTVGIILIGASTFLSEFRDDTLARQIIDELPSQEAPLSATATREWHERMDALRTSKFGIQDLGTGLFSMGAILLLLAKWQGLSVCELFKAARTPSTLWPFLVMGSIAWGLAFASFVYLLMRDLIRHEFPAWSDSIAIPMMGAALFFPWAWPVLLLIECAFVFKAPLPVGLWHWDQTRPLRSWSWSILLGGCTFFLFFLLLTSLVDGDVFMLPASGLGIYLFLSARAAIIARSFFKP